MALVAEDRGESSWVVCTDPNSGHVYYFNRAANISTWEKPAELCIDLAKPPPPPSQKKPPGPPARRATPVGPAGVGAWEEVRPEESQWEAGRQPETGGGSGGAGGEDSDDEATPLADMRCELMGRKGAWADEDLELREKEAFIKKSSSSAADEATAAGAGAAQPTFPITRKRAAGIRRRGGGDEEE